MIIKGIDLPSKGETIVLEIKGSKVSRLFPSRYKFQPTRYKDAKAIQIPKDHGRLIDWDAFNNKLDIQYAEGRGKALAPTILEAEGYK